MKKRKKNPHAVALGRSKSPAKRRAARERALKQWAYWRKHGGKRPGRRKRKTK